jgi:anti-sigma regulatory factor (Ser/Thr protein kinase)
MTGVQREIWLPADPTSAALARRAIREAALEAGMEATDTADVVLATSEAVANAIEHGSPRPGDMVRVSIHLGEGALTVEVGDRGTFPAQLKQDDTDRGRGLPIIGMLSDRVELEPGADGTVVRFAKRLAPVAAAAAGSHAFRAA